MSVDCDCAGINAAPPKARNLGILASIDMVYQLPEAELHYLKERIESRKGASAIVHERTEDGQGSVRSGQGIMPFRDQEAAKNKGLTLL